MARLFFFLLPLLALILSWPATEPPEQALPDLSGYPWVFLREGELPSSKERLAEVLIVGDVMLGRGVSGVTAPLGHVAGWLAMADLTLGNLEAVPATTGQPRQAPNGAAQPVILRAPASAVASLAQAGFDVVGLANNHSLDFGDNGLVEAIDRLEGAGIDVIGVVGDGETIRPYYREANGLRLALLAFNAVPDPHPGAACRPRESCRLLPAAWPGHGAASAIAMARLEADAVVVYVHWGFEYQPIPDPFQEQAAAEMLAAGADLIVGHHPHVAQPVVVAGDRLVAYSLGNLVFDQSEGHTGQGLALRAFFDESGLRAAQVLPLKAGPRPQLLEPAASADLLARVLPPPARLGFACDERGCLEADVSQGEQSGLFRGGQIDLTGDGRPEIVRREGERLAIYADGEAVWRSPPEWRVVDAALGDPNDDGRFEIMLAIWRRDEAGHERNQPYLVGHRQGVYRLLWGGRPVVDPIRELAVGDVDGDGVDELIVIEERADGSAQAVAVWQWSGWSFSLTWRGPYGRYRDLVLSADSPPRISVAMPAS